MIISAIEVCNDIYGKGCEVRGDSFLVLFFVSERRQEVGRCFVEIQVFFFGIVFISIFFVLGRKRIFCVGYRFLLRRFLGREGIWRWDLSFLFFLERQNYVGFFFFDCYIYIMEFLLDYFDIYLFLEGLCFLDRVFFFVS